MSAFEHPDFALGRQGGGWPAEAMASIFALGVGEPAVAEKRRLPRSSYAVQARLTLNGVTGEIAVYSHSISTRAAGFVGAQALAAGQRGTLFIAAPSGREMEIAVTIRRCRALASGWFDMSGDFLRAQAEFAEFNFPG